MKSQESRKPPRLKPIAVCLALLVSVAAVAWWLSPWSQKERQIVLLVTLDTLRADHLDFHGYPRSTAPRLAELAKRGVWFKRAMASTSSTSPSHATMLTGQYPYEHGVIANGNRLGAEVPTLATMLASQGYVTGAVLATSFLGEICSSFDHVDAASRNGKTITDRAIAWLNVVPPDRNVFLWVHYYDVHRWINKGRTRSTHRERLRDADDLEPGGIKDHITKLHGLTGAAINGPAAPFTSEALLRAIDDYDASILFADEQLGRLLDAVSTTFAERIVVATADHGEGLGSHGVTGHGVHLYEEQLHVPLIIDAPHLVERTQPVDALVHHIDLLPTIADMVGSAGLDTAKGRSLLPLLSSAPRAAWPDRFLFAQRGPFETIWLKKFNAVPEEQFVVRKGDMKLLVRTSQGEEIFDLAADALEQHALREDDRGKELSNVARDQATMILSVEEHAIPEELQEELRSLGYIE